MATNFYPVEAVTIRSGRSADVVQPQSGPIITKVYDPDFTRRILLKFDTRSILPGTRLERAELSLTILPTRVSQGVRSIAVRRCTKSFLQSATWNSYRAGSRWATPGGDYAEQHAVQSVPAVASPTRVSWDVTAFMQSTVDGAYDTRYLRFGLIDLGTDSGPGTGRDFAGPWDDDASLRPQLQVAVASDRPTPEPIPEPTPEEPTPEGSFTVATWNIHKSQRSDGAWDIELTGDTLIALDADVIGMNEVYFNWGHWSDRNQAEWLANYMTQRTGRDHAWRTVNITGGGAVGRGNAIISRLPIVDSSSKILSNTRGVVQVSVDVGGRTVRVCSTHLEYYNSTWRAQQLSELMAWLQLMPGPLVVTGDFNTRPGERDYNTMKSRHRDAWLEAKARGAAETFRSHEGTHGSSRFDYLWLREPEVQVAKVRVPDTRLGSASVYPSDHDPVVATLTVTR